jgi:hypothetical protein
MPMADSRSPFPELRKPYRGDRPSAHGIRPEDVLMSAVRTSLADWSRRRWLTAGTLGWTGLSLPELFTACASSRAAEQRESFGRAKRCVMLFLTGGVPQHDSWDPKPDAPANVRGELSPISTSVPGIQVSELFPQFARRVDRVTLLRSVTHDDTVHT